MYFGGQIAVVRLCLLSDGTRIVIEVHDQAAGDPVLIDASADSERGRGLAMVHALTGGRWGWHAAQGRPGKCVWAVLSLERPIPSCDGLWTLSEPVRQDGRLLSICLHVCREGQGGRMAYGQQPGQQGWPGDDGRPPPPQWRYGQQEYDQRGQQAGGDGRWQPPEWRYGQQRYEQGNGQPGYAPGQPQPRFQPTPPFQPGEQGYGPPYPQPPYRPPQPPQRGKSWPARHKALTGIFTFVGLIIIIVAANSGGSGPSPGSGTTTGLTTTASATATATPSQHATQAAATAHEAHPKSTQTTSAASQAPASSAPAPTAPAAVVAPPASAAPAGCHPLTSGGNCYKPGEYCRASDHGASGVAGDGEAITCEDNGGWRWEPS